jgi:hypothetical protein
MPCVGTSEDVVAMARWAGSIEVEGIAVCIHGMPIQRQVAIPSLTNDRLAPGGQP